MTNSYGKLLRVVRRPAGFVAVAVVAAAYLAATALRQHRPLVPLIHDENSYLLQARMLAHGHLCLPQHPLANFFESFHILVKPVYASIYFPGTAIFYVPWAWLGGGPWVVSVILYGLIVAMTYLIAAELLDGWAGLLAVLLLIATPLFRTYSVCALSQGPASLLGLVMVWAWLRWQRRQANRGRAAPVVYVVLIGACAGWMAITRPVDAVAFAAPIGIAMGFGLRREPWRQRLATAAVIVAAAAPFLALQAAFDRAVTGRVLETPYVLYLRQSQPGSTFGTTSFSPGARPASTLPQKQAFFDLLVPMQAKHRWPQIITATAERLAGVVCTVICSILLIPLALLGFVVGLAAPPDRRWRTVLAIPPLFFAFYVLNPYFLQHYALPLVPIAALAAVLGVRAIVQVFRTEARRRAVSIVLTAATAAVAIVSLPELDRSRHDEISHHDQLERIGDSLRTQVKAPAVVLFRYAPPADCLQEPVYNIDVCWPDDAPIIRAHDLGARDREIGAYYAARQPGRHFYLYDRGGERCYDLGTAADVAAAPVPADLSHPWTLLIDSPRR